MALEAASGRPTVWATAQYLSYALTDAELNWDVTLAAVGGHVTQGRAVGSVDGREILTVNAALGKDDLEVGGVWVEPPEVPPPDQSPPRFLPETLPQHHHGQRRGPDRPGPDLRGDGRLARAAPTLRCGPRVPGHLTPSAATLAIFGDYVSGAVSQPLGRRAMGRSLDNTLRMVQLKPTEWVLCDIRIHALSAATARASRSSGPRTGRLLATASQSIAVRLWPERRSPPEIARTVSTVKRPRDWRGG